MNLTADEATVRSLCAKHDLAISAIETLQSGGVRLVMLNLADADRVRALFKRQLIDGSVERVRWAGVS